MSALAGPDFDEGPDDAGNTVTTAKKVKGGLGKVERIRGSLTGTSAAASGIGDFVDVYEIDIDNPVSFSVSTSSSNFGAADFDTTIYVFTQEGFGAIANDDTTATDTASTVTPISSGGQVVIDRPGTWYVAIVGFPSIPTSTDVDGNVLDMWIITDPTDLIEANGPGADFLQTGWDTNGEIGTYEIKCESIEFVVDCGDSIAGSCWTPHGNQSCDDEECCKTVCSLDPICCEEEWDSGCVLLAEENCAPECGFCDGDLSRDGQIDGKDLAFFLASWGGEGCADLDENGVVDGSDLAMLLGKWGACASDCGNPLAGDCFLNNGTPYCDDEDCCLIVCAIDAFCCDVGWDATCVNHANENCKGEKLFCGVKGAGDCCSAHSTPYCDDGGCCGEVCAFEPDCCMVEWDSECVSLAASICDSCGGDECGSSSAGDCCSPNGTPGCDDGTCCDTVCAADPFCCTNEWDVSCADRAELLCGVCRRPPPKP